MAYQYEKQRESNLGDQLAVSDYVAGSTGATAGAVAAAWGVAHHLITPAVAAVCPPAGAVLLILGARKIMRELSK
jgi:hypothetical protein